MSSNLSQTSKTTVKELDPAVNNDNMDFCLPFVEFGAKVSCSQQAYIDGTSDGVAVLFPPGRPRTKRKGTVWQFFLKVKFNSAF